MEYLNQAEVKHWLIVGGTGRGKGYFIKTKILPTLEKKGIKTLIIDVEDEYIKYPVANVREIPEMLKKYNIIRYIPPPSSVYKEDVKKKAMALLYNLIFNCLRGICVIVEECHTVGARSRASMSSKNIDTFALIDLMSRGRKRNIKMILVSQRPSAIDSNIISHCSIRTYFKVNDNVDWERYRKLLTRDLFEKLYNSNYYYAHITTLDGNLIEAEL